MKFIFIVTLLLFSLKSQAYLTSDFDASWGVSFLNVSVGDVGSKSLESYSTIEVGYNLVISSIDTALNISFMELVNSNFGSIPFTRLAVGPRYYIRGLNGERVLLDNQVQGRVWRPSPFIGFQVGFGSLSIQDDTDTQFKNNFNAAIIDANVEMGLETPITSDWLLIGQISYLSSVLSGSVESSSTNGQSTVRPEITYGGLQIFIGLKITKF